MKFRTEPKKSLNRDAEILRYMRLSKGLSLRKAGALVRITNSAIAHIEQGRMEVSKARIETLVQAYGFSMADFMEFHDGKAVPVNLRDECILLLQKCTDDKLRVLHPVISNLAK